jgi:hypothetical protein
MVAFFDDNIGSLKIINGTKWKTWQDLRLQRLAVTLPHLEHAVVSVPHAGWSIIFAARALRQQSCTQGAWWAISLQDAVGSFREHGMPETH